MKTYSEFITERMINEKRDENAIMFIDAAKKGKVSVVKSLLDRGIDIDAKNEYGNNALTFAIYFKKFNVIKALVEAGANVNIELEGNLTPMGMALETGDQQIIDFLKDNGAVDGNEPDVEGENGEEAIEPELEA